MAKLTEFEALNYLIENKRKHWLEDDLSDECLEIIRKALRDYKLLQNGIEWRKSSYKKDLDRGYDADGDVLTETNRLILLNLYNIMTALESYYKED